MSEEVFPLVDEDGNIIGQASRSECHSGSKLLHPVIHLHVFDPDGMLYLQKRSATKDIQPNKWDSSVGGHIDLDETPLEAAIREAKEEIGLENIEPIYITKHIIETEVERELTYCFYCVTQQTPAPDKHEVSEGRFWDIKEIKNQLGQNLFTPNFELDFNTFLSKGASALMV